MSAGWQELWWRYWWKSVTTSVTTNWFLFNLIVTSRFFFHIYISFFSYFLSCSFSYLYIIYIIYIYIYVMYIIYLIYIYNIYIYIYIYIITFYHHCSSLAWRQVVYVLQRLCLTLVTIWISEFPLGRTMWLIVTVQLTVTHKNYFRPSKGFRDNGCSKKSSEFQ